MNEIKCIFCSWLDSIREGLQLLTRLGANLSTKKTTCPDTMYFKGKGILKNQKEISKKVNALSL